eukprot:9472906-Pyramimonas_sp.AAC.1
MRGRLVYSRWFGKPRAVVLLALAAGLRVAGASRACSSHLVAPHRCRASSCLVVALPGRLRPAVTLVDPSGRLSRSRWLLALLLVAEVEQSQ